MLGKTVKDRITGFTGVVTGHVQYLTGCNQALVVPPMQDGKLGSSEWFDVQRLEDTGVAAIVLDNGATPGCDRAAPKR
jgi:hypothetical protein